VLKSGSKFAGAGAASKGPKGLEAQKGWIYTEDPPQYRDPRNARALAKTHRRGDREFWKDWGKGGSDRVPFSRTYPPEMEYIG